MVSFSGLLKTTHPFWGALTVSKTWNIVFTVTQKINTN